MANSAKFSPSQCRYSPDPRPGEQAAHDPLPTLHPFRVTAALQWSQGAVVRRVPDSVHGPLELITTHTCNNTVMLNVGPAHPRPPPMSGKHTILARMARPPESAARAARDPDCTSIILLTAPHLQPLLHHNVTHRNRTHRKWHARPGSCCVASQGSHCAAAH